MFTKALVSRINMTVSNVRGPDEAMYLAGAKAMCFYPVSIPVDGCGLNFTGVSYNGVMWVSMVSCRGMVPDPGHMLECMRGAWEELLAAADALPDPAAETAEPNPAVKRRSGDAARTSQTTSESAKTAESADLAARDRLHRDPADRGAGQHRHQHAARHQERRSVAHVAHAQPPHRECAEHVNAEGRKVRQHREPR